MRGRFDRCRSGEAAKRERWVARVRCDDVADGELGADDRADAGGKRGAMEARRAVDAVAIEQRNRRVAVAGGLIDERFRQVTRLLEN